MKSTMRPASSILAATVDSSSDNVGDPATICWNSVSTLRCNASISEFLGAGTSGIDSTVAHMNGVSCVYSVTFTRSRPSAKTNRLWFGMRTTLCTTARLPTANRSVGCGIVHPRLALRHHHDGLVVAQRIDQLHRAFAPDGQGQHRMRKQNRIANRQHGEGSRGFRIIPKFGIRCY